MTVLVSHRQNQVKDAKAPAMRWLLPLAGLLLLVAVAGAADATVSMTAYAKDRGFATLERPIVFQVNNTGGASNDKITHVNFTVPSGWTLNTDASRHTFPTGWRVRTDGEGPGLTGTWLNITSNDGLALGQAINVTILSTSASEDSEADPNNWKVLAYSSSCNPAIQPCAPEVNAPVFLDTIGVTSLVIAEPAGAADLEVTSGQTVKFRAVVVNGRPAAVDAYVNISATGETQKPSIFQTAAISPSRTTNFEAWFTFNNVTTATTRTFDAKLQHGAPTQNGVAANATIRVVKPASLNGTLSQNIALASGSKDAISTRVAVETDPAGGSSTPNKQTNITVLLNNSGDADAVDIEVFPELWDASGVNQTSKFFINRTSPATILNLPSRGNTGTIRYQIEPVECPSTPCPNAPPEGQYNVSLRLRFHDLNKQNGTIDKVEQRIVNATKLFFVDSGAAAVTTLSPAPPSSLEFRRGGHDLVTFNVNISDPTHDRTAPKLFILDDRLKADCVTAADQGLDPRAEPRCKVTPTGIAMDASGEDWTAQFDFSGEQNRIRSSAGALFRALVVTKDRAGHIGQVFYSNLIHLKDTTAPVVTALDAPSEAPLGSAIFVRASVKDDHVLNKTWVRVYHVESNSEVSKAGQPGALSNAGERGIPMTCPNCLSGPNGTYEAQFFVRLSGTYLVRVQANDTIGLQGESQSPAEVTLKVSSALSFFIAEPGGNVFGKNFTQTGTNASNVSQVRQAVYDAINLRNEAGGSESFNFECRILTAGTNVPGLQACNVNYAMQGETVAAGAAPRQERSWANTVNITIYDIAGSPRTFVDNATGIVNLAPFATKTLRANVTVPPAALPGHVVRVELIAKPKFSSERAVLTLGYEVSPGRGVDGSFSDGNPVPSPLGTPDADDGGAITRVIKPTRATTYTFRVNNTGNVDTRFDIKTTGLPSGWLATYDSSNSGWNAQTRSIALPPVGSLSGTNSGTVRVTITAPAGTSESADPTLTITAEAANPPGANITKALTLRLDVRRPTVDAWYSSVNWTAQSGQGPASNVIIHNPSRCTPSTPSSGPVCPFVETNATGPGWNRFDLRTQINSTRNTNPDNPGLIRAELILTTPCGASCGAAGEVRLPLRAVGGQPDGHDGAYAPYAPTNVSLNITDDVGKWRARLFVSDFDGATGDEYTTENVTLTITEPGTPTPPALSNVEVRQGSAASAVLVRDSLGHYRVNFGLPVFVKATLTDTDGGLGSAALSIERRRAGSSSNDIIAEVPMARTTGSTQGGRVITATFEGSYKPTGGFSEGFGGEYVFRVVGRDANLQSAGLTPENPFFVDMLDLEGPSIRPLLVSGAVSGAALSVETGLPVNITARITDNSDALNAPGGAVNRTEGRAPFAHLVFGTTVKNYTLVQVQGSLAEWTFSIPAADIATKGTYAIDLFAFDTSLNGAKNSTTLNVADNLAPTVTVTSPVAGSDGARVAGGGAPIVVAVQDSNLNPNTTGAIRVELQQGANFTAFTGFQVTGASPQFVVTITPTGEGNFTYRVTATDPFGLSNSTTFAVRVDTAPPSAAAVSVDPLDISGGKAFRAASTDPFTLSPTARLLVTATDSGGIGQVTVSVRPASGGTARNLTLAGASDRFTLAQVLGTAALDGEYVVGARVQDRVGNAASAPEVTVRLDATSPTLGAVRPASPLSVTASDLRSGVRLVEVEWAESADGARSTFSLAKGSGDTWTGDFPAEASGTVFFLVRATDNVGNAAEARCGTALCQLPFGNRAPVVTAAISSGGQAVAGGGAVRGNVSIGWTAADPEGSQVLVTVKVRDAAGAEQTLATEATLSPIVWDTSDEKDGAWTVTLTGTDGRLTNTTTVNVVVRNTRVALEQPLPANVAQGGSVLLAYDIEHPSKAIRSASAVLRVGGERETVQLYDDGTHGDRTARDGTFSATYTPRLRGQYAVDLQVTYDDNARQDLTNVGTFEAQGNLGPVTPVTFYVVLVLGAVAVALGVLGIRRWP